MTTSTPDLAKIQNLIATATNARQKAMYQKLLEKAKKQLGESEEASPQNTQQTKTKLDSISSSTKQSASVSSTVKAKPLALPKQKKKVAKDKNKGKSETSNKKASQSKTENKTETGKETSTKKNQVISVKKTEKSDDKKTKQKKNKSTKKSKKTEKATAAKSDSYKKSQSDKPTEPVKKPKIIIFQAIGVIEGLVSMEEEQLWITLEEDKYCLGYVPHKKVIYDALVADIKDTGSNVKKVSVYPQLTHNKEKKEIEVKFSLVSVSKSEKDKALFKKLVPGEFQVSGFWQYVPFSDLPCVSIKRNYTRNLARIVSTMEIEKAKYFLRSNVIPLVWNEPTVEPFKYNPELEKPKQMPRYFVQLKVAFTPTENKFTFVEQQEEPLLEAPRYLKP